MEPNQQLLTHLPEKKKPTIIGFVRDHIDEIRATRAKGYSYAEIYAELIQQTEHTFTVGTFTKYVQRINNEQKNNGRSQSRLNVLPLPQTAAGGSRKCR